MLYLITCAWTAENSMKSSSLLLISGFNVKPVAVLISRKCFQPTHLYQGNQRTSFPVMVIPPVVELLQSIPIVPDLVVAAERIMDREITINP